MKSTVTALHLLARMQAQNLDNPFMGNILAMNSSYSLAASLKIFNKITYSIL